MNTVKRFLNTIPLWAFVLVIVVFITNSLYLYFKYQVPEDTSTYRFENGQVIFNYIRPGSPDDRAGIKSGDVLVSIDSIPIDTWNSNSNYAFSAGDSVSIEVLRGGRLLEITTKMTTMGSNAPVFYWSVYIIMLLFNIAGLFILFRKPKDKTVKLFFIYLQLFSVTINAFTLPLPNMVSVSATWIFLMSSLLMGPVLIHFHLLFPRPSWLYFRLRILPKILFAVAALYFVPYAAGSYLLSFNYEKYYSLYSVLDRISLIWITLTFFIALSFAIFQYVTIRDTLSRNQIRMVIIGSFFGFITPMTYGLFYKLIESYGNYSRLVMIPHGIGSIIMILFIVVAIFRYRIWDTEVFFRKALLYMGATLIITMSYLLLIYVADQYIAPETNLTRFIILAVSVIFFLLLRDWMQRRIDRFFHRESYDSATVVTDFEEKMTETYKLEDLGYKIMKGMDEIFHFKWMVMAMKKEEMTYIPAYLAQAGMVGLQQEIISSAELEEKLKKAKVFAPAELDDRPVILDLAGSELVVPLLKEDQPAGFFLCGPKRSEKTYSMQDIRVLTLIAKRVIAIFQTATLYQQDLDRQLLLERERTRISKDMHDDIGAGLTKIAMISEAGALEEESAENERMQKIAVNARAMISRLNVIVWALNPRYDNLASLISYARRYFGEYLDNFSITFKMDVSEEIPDLPVTPDFRRNVFYAWQEAVHNAVKHSDCSVIRIAIRIEGTRMLVIISDDGKGFDHVPSGSGGNGLMNMRIRAEDMGGSFEIQSEPGKGTKVTFGIPVAGGRQESKKAGK